MTENVDIINLFYLSHCFPWNVYVLKKYAHMPNIYAIYVTTYLIHSNTSRLHLWWLHSSIVQTYKPAPQVFIGFSPAYLVEFVFQQAGVQTQLREARLPDCLDDPIHLSVVLAGQVGEVDVRGDERFAQHLRLQVAQDLLSVPWRVKDKINCQVSDLLIQSFSCWV